MVTLPSNVTTAGLALLLGALLGAAGTHYLTSSSKPEPRGLGGQVEGQGVLERIRQIAPRDTSGQDEPDVEIRYKTRRDTVRDSVYVPIPSTLPRSPALSSREPIEVTPSRVTWSYFDAADAQWQQRVYSVPERRFEWSAHAALRGYTTPPPAEKRLWVGLATSLQYMRLEFSVGAFTTPALKRQRLTVGLRWQVR